VRADSPKEILERVVCELFEQMYFMFPEVGVHGRVPEGSPDVFIEARVKIDSGELVVVCSEKLAQKMAGNMFEGGRPLSGDVLTDIVREAANIIAGNCINEMGLGGNLSADIPVFRVKAAPHVYTVAGDPLFFDVEGEIMSVGLRG